MTEPIDIYIDYDAKEIVAYHALCQSIAGKSPISANDGRLVAQAGVEELILGTK